MAHIKEIIEDLRLALEESVKLQNHYAQLLNDYDQGERMTFETAGDWINRLKEVGKIPKVVIGG